MQRTYCTLPWRFSEWSQAAWQLQRDFLIATSPEDPAWDVRFLSIFHDDDAKYAESCQQLVCGRAMQQWWDISEAAGPKARASEPFSEGIPELECLTVVDNELKSLGRLIFDFLGDITYRIF